MGTVMFVLSLLKDVVPMVVAGISGAREILSEGVRLVDEMVEQKREPTSAECKALNDRIATLRNALHSDNDDLQQHGEMNPSSSGSVEGVSGQSSLGNVDTESVPPSPPEPAETSSGTDTEVSPAT